MQHVCISGRVDAARCQELLSVLELPAQTVHLDLEQVTFVDHHAIDTIRQIDQQLSHRNQRLELRHVPDAVRLALEITTRRYA
ncbi:MAG: STAS domain-containing protein [Pleurocapsa sp. SU_196_0]|nr:STAS domain-containing protein [Pleurocapsa sp. SU_196_0]